jgi:hypothetical protein
MYPYIAQSPLLSDAERELIFCRNAEGLFSLELVGS